MGEPATLVESVTTPVVTAIPTPKAGETEGKRGFDSGETAEKVGGRWRSLFGPQQGSVFRVSKVVFITIPTHRSWETVREKLDKISFNKCWMF